MLADLRTDEFARSILSRVDQGPFGSSSRSASTQKSTSEGGGGTWSTSAGAGVGATGESSRSRKESRASRDPRINREIVSMDHGMWFF